MPRTSRQAVEQHYDAAEAASLLNVSEATVWAWIRAGRLSPVVRLSARCTRIPASAINNFLRRASA